MYPLLGGYGRGFGAGPRGYLGAGIGYPYGGFYGYPGYGFGGYGGYGGYGGLGLYGGYGYGGYGGYGGYISGGLL
jgi:hypothetical protein